MLLSRTMAKGVNEKSSMMCLSGSLHLYLTPATLRPLSRWICRSKGLLVIQGLHLIGFFSLWCQTLFTMQAMKHVLIRTLEQRSALLFLSQTLALL